jgi:hypothetical protein
MGAEHVNVRLFPGNGEVTAASYSYAKTGISLLKMRRHLGQPIAE